MAILLTVACAATTSTVPVSSTATGPGKGHGPPPHAPAHGYRAKTSHGVAIVWDSGLGVYVAIDLPSTYYLEDRYYRHDTDGWAAAVDIEGEWGFIGESDLPPGLRGQKPGKGKSKPKKKKD